MRHILGAVLIVLAASASALMPPLKINYQGRLVDPTTNQPKTGPVTLTFKLYRTPDPADTSFYWSEVQSGVQLANGVFSVQLGSATLLHPDLLANTSAYLGIQVTGDASEMQPRQQLAMSPYAYSAVQLVSSTTIRVNAGVAYSTFTADGSLDLQAGIDATTGVFTGSGNTLYTLEISSGIRLSSGTILLGFGGTLDASAGGVQASSITATTATFTGTGSYSLKTSSGINVTAGTLLVQGAGSSIEAANNIKASGFIGDGSDLTGTAPLVAQSSSVIPSLTLVSGTERLISYSTITLTAANKDVMVFAMANVGKVNSAAACAYRIYRGTVSNGTCTTGGTSVYATLPSVTASAAGQTPLVMMGLSPSPGAGTWTYCASLKCAAAYVVGDRSLMLVEAAPASSTGVSP